VFEGVRQSWQGEEIELLQPSSETAMGKEADILLNSRQVSVVVFGRGKGVRKMIA